MNEEWRPINGYYGYHISSFGRVYSDQSNSFRAAVTQVRGGYLGVTIKVNGFVTTLRIHRLVAHAFVPGWFPGAQVNHKDGNKSNNLWTNLEWVTRSENIQHAYDSGLNPGRAKIALKNLDTGEIYKSVLDCARELGVSRSLIMKHLNNPRKSLHGIRLERL